jgi:hypothetical protein
MQLSEQYVKFRKCFQKNKQKLIYIYNYIFFSWKRQAKSKPLALVKKVMP